MIKEISEKFVEYIAEDKCTMEETEELQYVVGVILYELLKMSMVILIFWLAGYLVESMIIMIVMYFTKPYIGGYHEETQIRCLIANVLFTAGEILLSKQCSFSFFGNLILICACIFA